MLAFRFMSIFQKIYLSFLILLTVATICVGVFILFNSEEVGEQAPVIEKEISSREDDTANWQTYRSDESGFEFRYPQEFSVSTDVWHEHRGNGNVSLATNDGRIISITRSSSGRDFFCEVGKDIRYSAMVNDGRIILGERSVAVFSPDDPGQESLQCPSEIFNKTKISLSFPSLPLRVMLNSDLPVPNPYENPLGEGWFFMKFDNDEVSEPEAEEFFKEFISTFRFLD